MAEPRRFNFTAPLRGLVKKRNPATVPVDASADSLNLSYEAGQYGCRRGYYIARRFSSTNGYPGKYGSYVRISDGAIFPWFLHNGALYADQGVHLAAAQLETGWRSSRVPAHAEIPNGVIFNGETDVAKTPVIYDGDSTYDAGMAAPGSTPTVGTGGAGTGQFGGLIRVVVTFGSDVWNVESEPCSIAVPGAFVQNTSLNLTNIPTSADPRCDYRNIWVTQADGQVYLLALKIADNTTTSASITDWASDTTVLAREGGFFATAVVPQGDVMAYHEGRLFIASGSTLYWSRLGSPEVFHPLAQAALQDPKGITFLKSHNGRLLVGGRSRLWSMSGEFDMNPDGTSNYTARLLSEGVGVVGRDAGDAAGTVFYFLSDQGIMSQSGDESPVPISDDKVEPLIDEINDAWSSEAYLRYVKNQGEIWCAVPMRNVQNPNQLQRVICFRQRGENYSFHHLRLSSLSLAYDDGQELELFGADYHGTAIRLNYGHGDGLQGNELYGPDDADGNATYCTYGIPCVVGTSAANGQTVVTLTGANLPDDGVLRSCMVVFVNEDSDSSDYGLVETHKIIDNDQSADTITVEDPVGNVTHAYLGGIHHYDEPPRTDAGVPGSQKIVRKIEFGIVRASDA